MLFGGTKSSEVHTEIKAYLVTSLCNPGGACRSKNICVGGCGIPRGRHSDFENWLFCIHSRAIETLYMRDMDRVGEYIRSIYTWLRSP